MAARLIAEQHPARTQRLASGRFSFGEPYWLRGCAGNRALFFMFSGSSCYATVYGEFWNAARFFEGARAAMG